MDAMTEDDGAIEVKQVTIVYGDDESAEVCWYANTESAAIKALIRDVCGLNTDRFFLVSMETGIACACSSALPDGGTFEVGFPSTVKKEKKAVVTKKRPREESVQQPNKKKKFTFSKKKSLSAQSRQARQPGQSVDRKTNLTNVLDRLNTPKGVSKNKLFQWFKEFGFEASETDKAVMKWELRRNIRKELGIKFAESFNVDENVKVFWDAAVGNDQKWYFGNIMKKTGETATLKWNNDAYGIDEFNLNHLYMERC